MFGSTIGFRKFTQSFIDGDQRKLLGLLSMNELTNPW